MLTTEPTFAVNRNRPRFAYPLPVGAIATGTPASGQVPTYNSATGQLSYTTLSGSAIGFLTGKDRNRPAVTAANVYLATDTNQVYASDGVSLWYNVATGAPDKCSLDNAVAAGGFTDAVHMAGPLGNVCGPPLSAASTLAIMFYVISTPGTTNTCLACYATAGSSVTGWNILTSTVNSNKMTLLLGGVNGSALIQMTGNAALTTGVHCLCFSLNGTTVHYCLDGGTVTNAGALGGTYAVPLNTAIHYIGRFTSAGFSAPWFRFVGLQTYNAVLSDADMQTVSGNFANYRFGAVTTDPDYDWHNSWYRLEGTCSNVSILPYRASTAPPRAAYLTGQGQGLSRVTY